MIRDIITKQTSLVIAGSICFLVLIVLAILSLLDPLEIMGINRWIKPMKFTLSIGVYLWTVAFYLYFIPGRERSKKIISFMIPALMLGELVLIIMQAARGTTSHYNNDTAFDGLVFSAMGMMIVINTILIVYLLIVYFLADVQLHPAVVWGMRLGIILFLLASVEGGYMSVILHHSVGVADGGPGLPFVNWSTEGGDLRAAHFVGMHALQTVPLFAWVMVRLRAPAAMGLTFVFSALYFGCFSLMLILALQGRPLWPLN